MRPDERSKDVTPEDRMLEFKSSLVMAMGLLPQNILSFLVGALVRLRWPGAIQRVLNQLFVDIFGINMGEAEKSLDSYESLEEIFTRALKPNQREIQGPYVSSADGVLEMSRPVQSGDEAVQAKGITYSLSKLVFGDEARELKARWYTTVYLAPHNYHRVHAPIAGKVTGMRYISGRLWPVNRPAVKAIAGLFGKNERLVFDMELATGGKAWVVMVGAFNVGRMVTRLNPGFVTNAASELMNAGGSVRELDFGAPQTLAAGDELGIFMLGSTTVVVLDEAAAQGLKPRDIVTPMKVTMGQNLSQ